MSLHRVGLCGVDDSVDPSLLSAIVSRWPRVELGVLFRPGKEGQPRFPTRRWLEQLAKTACPGKLPFSRYSSKKSRFWPKMAKVVSKECAIS